MAPPSSPKDKFFEKFINSYLLEVIKHPQTIEMCERVLHIRYVQGPKKTGRVGAKLERVEQHIFNCKGMVEQVLSANHSMIMEFARDHMVDGQSMRAIVFTFNEQINFLQSQIYDLQSQIFEYEARFKGMSLIATCRTHGTRASTFDGEPLL
ncbi:40S ribosomal protein S5-1 [Hordeum vulgare]|nr:40S ribosomal protein S5-1 [Hordeum vulgare]